MATAAVTVTAALTDRYSQTGVAMTMAAADVANGNHLDISKNIIVLAHNTHGSTTYTVTITSSGDATTGRTGSVTSQNLAAGEIRLFKLQPDGWIDGNDQYLVSANNAAVTIGFIEG